MTRRSPPEFLEIRPFRGGCELVLGCHACASTFEIRQETIGGLVFGWARCPVCGEEHELRPDAFCRAVEQTFVCDLAETAREAEWATELTESWHQNPVLRSLLLYRGVELGPPTERELLAPISEALRELSLSGKAG